jgi:hypothetical protein
VPHVLILWVGPPWCDPCIALWIYRVIPPQCASRALGKLAMAIAMVARCSRSATAAISFLFLHPSPNRTGNTAGSAKPSRAWRAPSLARCATAAPQPWRGRRHSCLRAWPGQHPVPRRTCFMGMSETLRWSKNTDKMEKKRKG